MHETLPDLERDCHRVEPVQPFCSGGIPILSPGLSLQFPDTLPASSPTDSRAEPPGVSAYSVSIPKSRPVSILNRIQLGFSPDSHQTSNGSEYNHASSPVKGYSINLWYTVEFVYTNVFYFMLCAKILILCEKIRL